MYTTPISGGLQGPDLARGAILTPTGSLPHLSAPECHAKIWVPDAKIEGEHIEEPSKLIASSAFLYPE
jgi:hypothetical protein